MDTERLIHLATKNGLVTDEQLAEAREEKGRQSAAGNDVTLWEALCLLGYVDAQKQDSLRATVETTVFSNIVLKGYHINRRLGSGGFGDLYIAVGEDGQEVVAKILPRRYAADPEHVARFQDEVTIAQAIDHPHVVKTLASGMVDGRPYLIAELIRGVTLRERIHNDGPLSQYEGLVVLQQCAEALRAIQEGGFVHRDVKPANILLGPPREDRDEPFCLKLCDFGLAKHVAAAPETGGTKATELITSGQAHPRVAFGTPHFVSPEQAAGEPDVDFRTDIYGLGATLYYALVGQTVFTGKTTAIISRKAVTETINVDPLLERGFDIGLVDLLRDMLRRTPAERPESWDAVLARVGRAIPLTLAGLQPAEVAITNSELIGPEAFDEHAFGATVLLKDLSSRRRSAIRLVFVTVVVMVFLAILLLALLPDPEPLPERRATSDNLAETITLVGTLLDAPEGPAEMVIRLEPGVYRDRLVLTAGHDGLILDASAKDVILESEAGTALRFEAGCTNVVIRGLRIRAVAPVIIEVEAGGAITFESCRFDGAPVRLRAVGASVVIRDSQWGGGFDVDDCSLKVVDSIVSNSGMVLRGRDSVLRVEQCRFLLTGETASCVLLRGGSFDVDGMEIRGRGPAPVLVTEDCSFIGVRRLLIHGGEQGWVSRRCQVRLISDLRCQVDGTAFAWEGPLPAKRDWQRITLEAPTPSTGLDGMAFDGQAPTATALQEPLPR